MSTGPFVPFEHWPAPVRQAIAAAYAIKAEETAERIRNDPTWQRCSCATPTYRTDGGRCDRCYGRSG